MIILDCVLKPYSTTQTTDLFIARRLDTVVNKSRLKIEKWIMSFLASDTNSRIASVLVEKGIVVFVFAVSQKRLGTCDLVCIPKTF